MIQDFVMFEDENSRVMYRYRFNIVWSLQVLMLLQRAKRRTTLRVVKARKRGGRGEKLDIRSGAADSAKHTHHSHTLFGQTFQGYLKRYSVYARQKSIPLFQLVCAVKANYTAVEKPSPYQCYFQHHVS